MKALKSIVLMTAGVLALSACDMKKKDVTTRTTTTNEESAVGTTTTPDNSPNANGVGATVAPTSPATTTTQGSGAVSDDAASEDLNDENYDEDYSESDEAVSPTSTGTGQSSDDYEYVDESSSEPNNVRGGRDARMVPKNNQIDNTSSEPDSN